jgi:uncharacterized protein YmfQ (DUF2313 family)
MPDAAAIEKHLRALYGSLPRGLIWVRRAGVREKVLRALATEHAEIQARADQLLLESDPRTTTEMIGDWEEALGLPPIESLDPQPTLDERRAAAAAKYAAVGGAAMQGLIDAAAALGFVITIIEYWPFVPAGMGSSLGDSLWDQEWNFFFEVVAPSAAIGSTLEQTIRAKKPAWTACGFTYV